MVLRPRWPQGFPPTEENAVRLLAQETDGLLLDILAVEMHRPAAPSSELGQHLAVHDRVGAALIWHSTLDGYVLGKVGGPGVEARWW